MTKFAITECDVCHRHFRKDEDATKNVEIRINGQLRFAGDVCPKDLNSFEDSIHHWENKTTKS